jgi:hypothetical protein
MTRWSRLTGRVQLGPTSALRSPMDRRVMGERSDAVLRTAMPGDDELFRCRDAPSHPSFATPRKAKPKKAFPRRPPNKKGGGAPRSAPNRSRIDKRCGAHPLSCLPTAGGPRPPWTSKMERARSPFGAPPRHPRLFRPRLGSGRASWNHRMQTGGPSPAPVQRAPRSPARAERDDAQAARERSVWPRSTRTAPAPPSGVPSRKASFASGIWVR